MADFSKVAQGWDAKLKDVLALDENEYAKKDFTECDTIMALGDLSSAGACVMWEVYKNFPELLEQKKIKEWNDGTDWNDASDYVTKGCPKCIEFGYSHLICHQLGEPEEIQEDFGEDNSDNRESLKVLKARVNIFYKEMAPAIVDHLQKDHGIKLD